MVDVRHCPICSGLSRTLISANGKDMTSGQKVYYCWDCGSAYQSPRLSDAALREYYAAQYAQDYRGAESPNREAIAHRDKLAAERWELVSRHLLRKKKMRLLEVGCGAGNFMSVCVKHGIECVGYEPSAGYAQYAKSEGLRVYTEMFSPNQCRHAEGEFGAVAMFHVLEHLPNPTEFLDGIRYFLDKDATLLVEVPDLGKSLGPGWRENYFHAPHLVDLTGESIRTCLSKSGFSEIKRFYHRSPRRRHHLLVVARCRNGVQNKSIADRSSATYGRLGAYCRKRRLFFVLLTWVFYSRIRQRFDKVTAKMLKLMGLRESR